MTPLDPSISLVLLAAGRGRRFGGDKLAIELDGRPLWKWSAQAAEEAGFQTRYLVVGAHSSVGPRSGWQRVLSPDADRGMGASIAAGVAAAEACLRVVIALADMPYVEARHLRLLGEGAGAIFTRQADGSAGAPAAFDRVSFAQLRSLDGGRGARSLQIPGASIVEPNGPDMLLDIDTPGDLPTKS